ncbi:MAG: IS110 family transposase [bacterium]|nr:IS110 family transposase [bacterium]
MKKKIACIGVDYHIKSVSIGVMIKGEKDMYDTVRLVNEDKVIKKYFKKVSKEFEIRICYEASGAGFTFQRTVKKWGYHCDVIAPSLIPKKPGDKRKNDFRDACNLTRLYAQDMLTVVHPPTEKEESIRSLVRCRIALKETAKKAKQQINTFLLGKGFHWPKSKWTEEHRVWLSNLKMYDRHAQMALDEHIGHLEYLGTRILHLENEIEEIARLEPYASSVNKLVAFKGIGILTAMLLITEITDFRRFPNPRALMAFLGLVPSEDSSGDRQKGGGITKAGNKRCRTYLVESARHYIKKPRIGSAMKKDLGRLNAGDANIVMKCMQRLHKRYWALVMKGKSGNKALTAVAREFVGFIWAMMRTNEAECNQHI